MIINFGCFGSKTVATHMLQRFCIFCNICLLSICHKYFDKILLNNALFVFVCKCGTTFAICCRNKEEL